MKKTATKILVTGGAGFIGSHLCDALLGQGFRVTAVDCFDPFYPEALKRRNIAQASTHPHFELIEGNLIDPAVCLKAVQGCDVVVHLAAKAGVRPSIEAPQSYIDYNLTATQTLLDAMRTQGVRKIVFASSSSVYGNTPHTPWHEQLSVDNPISPYAFTKKAGELLLHTYHHLYQMDAIALRFFTVFGPRQRPDLAIHKFFNLAMKNRSIPFFGNGTTSRDYTYVADTVAGICSAIDYVQNHSPVFEIVNLGNNTSVTLNQLIEEIGHATGKNIVLEKLPMQPGDVEITYADISKAQQLFNYHPKTSLQEGLLHFKQWWLNEGLSN